MEIIETQLFTRLITEILADEHYRLLQNALIDNPDAGDVIPNGAGLRKFRWGLENIGKRGGLRVIYLWRPRQNLIYFVTVYKKNRQEDLTPDQLKILAKVVKEHLK